ncbi:MAG TPA: ankyrin repeat domain-containing protein [Verrucomicrobiota bacterium]|nr:ankyrin repeat domain-containing protein [Verrucomicrobiota bacterium]
MKHILITTIVAVLLTGCKEAPEVDLTLHEAISKGHDEMVELLIEQGADVNGKDVGGGTPLGWAAKFGHKEIARLLIAQGADVNAKNYFGWTPLHEAAGVGHNKICELLIEKGADVNARANGGWTPLQDSAMKGHTEVVKILIANGAIVNARVYGKTPLDWADERKKKEVTNILRKHGGRTGEELKAEGK